MNLHRLVYTSSRRPNCTNEEITKILETSKKNNPPKNITGILLHSQRRFIQYLEGDREELIKLYDKIAKDPRHGGLNIRDFEPIQSRTFPNWHMAFKDVSKNALKFNTLISSQDKEIFKDLIEGDLYNREHGLRILKAFFEIA